MGQGGAGDTIFYTHLNVNATSLCVPTSISILRLGNFLLNVNVKCTWQMSFYRLAAAKM